MKSLSKSFGENIRLARQMKSLTQENVAEVLEMSHSGYAKIERGETDISLSRIEEIAKALDVAPEQLITEGKSLIFNIKTNQRSPLGNSGGNVHYENDIQELNALLKKSLELLSLLIEDVRSNRK